MAATIPELVSRAVASAHHALDAVAKCREEAIRAREAAAEAQLPRRAQAALRAAYVCDREERPAPTAREALSAFERRGSERGRHLAPLGTAAVAVCALLIVVIVLAAPTTW